MRPQSPGKWDEIKKGCDFPSDKKRRLQYFLPGQWRRGFFGKEQSMGCRKKRCLVPVAPDRRPVFAYAGPALTVCLLVRDRYPRRTDSVL